MIVIDCSTALEIAKQTDRGRAFQEFITPEEEVIAPVLFAAEVTNAAWKHVHAGLLDETLARNLVEDALALPDRLVPLEDLLVEAYTEGNALDHSVYDMLYLVLARRNAATLFTCDRKLQECCLTRNIDCVVEVAL